MNNWLSKIDKNNEETIASLQALLSEIDLLTPESKLLVELIEKHKEIKNILIKFMWNGGK